MVEAMGTPMADLCQCFIEIILPPLSEAMGIAID
jgi:hypothetical protein